MPVSTTTQVTPRPSMGSLAVPLNCCTYVDHTFEALMTRVPTSMSHANS
jgi:hypothetical protein